MYPILTLYRQNYLFVQYLKIGNYNYFSAEINKRFNIKNDAVFFLFVEKDSSELIFKFLTQYNVYINLSFNI